MNYAKAIKMTKRHEGLRLKPYLCTANKLTIGYGRNIEDVGITEHEASFLLHSDILNAKKELKEIFSKFGWFSNNRQTALVCMMFNLGKTRFLKFKKMIEAIKNNNWERAAVEALDSKWAKQVGNRAIEIAELLKGDV